MARHDRSRAAIERAKTDYGTPDDVYGVLHEAFGFTIDLAAHKGNAKHPRFYSPQQNSLAQSWEGETGFLNMPYGRGIEQWLQKQRDEAINARAIVVGLPPANVGSSWWRRLVMGAELDDAGRLEQSYFVPETQVLWLRWEGLITGVHIWPERIPFIGDHGAAEPAMFDSAVVIQASPNRAPPPSSRRPGSLTWRWPR